MSTLDVWQAQVSAKKTAAIAAVPANLRGTPKNGG